MVKIPKADFQQEDYSVFIELEAVDQEIGGVIKSQNGKTVGIPAPP